MPHIILDALESRDPKVQLLVENMDTEPNSAIDAHLLSSSLLTTLTHQLSVSVFHRGIQKCENLHSG